MRDHLHHRFVEFFVAYQVVLIAIYFVHDLVPEILVALFKCSLAERTMEHSPDLFLADESIAIFVKDVECDSEIFTI